MEKTEQRSVLWNLTSTWLATCLVKLHSLFRYHISQGMRDYATGERNKIIIIQLASTGFNLALTYGTLIIAVDPLCYVFGACVVFWINKVVILVDADRRPLPKGFTCALERAKVATDAGNLALALSEIGSAGRWLLVPLIFRVVSIPTIMLFINLCMPLILRHLLKV